MNNTLILVDEKQLKSTIQEVLSDFFKSEKNLVTKNTSRRIVRADVIEKEFGIKKHAVYFMAKNNKIPCFCKHGRYYFDVNEVEEWFAKSKVETIEE